MGTRGTYGFIINSEPRLSYNHFDSYPSGLGKEIFEFIKDINKENGWDVIKDRVLKLQAVNSQDKPPKNLYVKYKQYSQNVSNGPENEWYALLRNLQGSEWMYELTNGLEHYIFENHFIEESLFCEYGYIINLDTMCLEYYEGFQKEPQEGNKFGTIKNSSGYYPCKLIIEIPLNYVDEISTDDLQDKQRLKVLTRKIKLKNV